ncbi:MAG: phytanoyl-CoA dioxygenase family protein [Planctomycetota bacterium]|nr:phytanoyl-CoA dioxygenase family protein [Planctomycetota bacterium]
MDEPERCFKQAVACPLPPGGASLHHSYLLHYAGPNRSETPRRAYILTFAVPPAPRREKRVFSWQQNENTSRQRRRKEHEAKTVMS